MNHTTPRKDSRHRNVMSGMRPTGRLHLGHYFGVLRNWVKMQQDYDCYYMVADWHALTTQYNQTDNIRDNIREMVLDWLAAGVDPEKATLYVQSTIPEIAELHLLLSMLTPLPWVQGDPTLKDMVKMLTEDLNYGLLGYPVLQTVDILIVMGQYVPVGKDQLAHLEISRDIARRFNHMYGIDLFPEPQPLLTETPLVAGLDGGKMGKSAGNALFLSDTEDETAQKIRTRAVTDPARVKREDPGNPENCEVVFKYYQLFAPPDAIQLADQECRAAARGCVDCKKILIEFVNETLRPIRERRRVYASDPGQVDALLAQGQERVRTLGTETLKQVRQAMKLYQNPTKVPV